MAIGLRFNAQHQIAVILRPGYLETWVSARKVCCFQNQQDLFLLYCCDRVRLGVFRGSILGKERRLLRILVGVKLLCLSNGHGEDAIAIRILLALKQQIPSLELAALPMVGEGKVYTRHDIPLIGPTQNMPSGGFVYMDGKQLARDLQGGLLQLTMAQFRVVRSWAKQKKAAILAVGDIVPLLFAWLSGVPYGFVGTAKSEYYLRDEAGLLPRRTWFEQLESWSGSVYLPGERCLMRHRRCKAVFPRDSLTAQRLRRFSVPAFDLGNPMMDDLDTKQQLRASSSPKVAKDASLLTLVLLPGSRSPEAYRNWQQLVLAMADCLDSFINQPFLFLAAIAPGLEMKPFCKPLEAEGWQESISKPKGIPKLNPTKTREFSQRQASLIVTQQAFAACLQQADFALAMAGTATEQFVGLGKPAIALPGQGPQFTPAFAEAQTRLLGPSVILLERPDQVGDTLQALLEDPDRLHLIAENGRRRLGKPGAARRIAACFLEQLRKR